MLVLVGMGNMTHHYSSVPNESSYNGLALDLPDHNALVLRGLQEKGGGLYQSKYPLLHTWTQPIATTVQNKPICNVYNTTNYFVRELMRYDS